MIAFSFRNFMRILCPKTSMKNNRKYPNIGLSNYGLSFPFSGG